MKHTAHLFVLGLAALFFLVGCSGSSVQDRDVGGNPDAIGDGAGLEVSIHPDGTQVDGMIEGECKTAADCVTILGDELDQCHDPVCDTTGERAVCVAVAKADGSVCDDGNGCTSDDACQAGVCTGTAIPDCVCSEDADCAPYEDGDLCNGTLECVDGLCLVDDATIVQCPTEGDTDCLQNTCAPETGDCALAAVEDGTVCTGDDPDCAAFECQSGDCVCACTPQCEGRECGPDGCGSNCGVCDAGETCEDGTCVPSVCDPPCDASACEVCVDSACVSACAADEICEDGQCVTCTPDCTGLECGPDPVCGSSCGACDPGYFCQEGACVEGGDLTCEDPQPLACGDTMLGDTTAATNLIETYSCVGWAETGGEHVFMLSVPENADVTLTLTELTADLDLFVLQGSCDGAECVAYSADTADESVTFTAVVGTQYYVVIDGYDAAVSSYTLAATCGAPCVPECGDLQCGPDPVCGVECGPCGDTEVCNQGVCIADPCDDLPYEGCCDGSIVSWCEEGEFFSVDCSGNEAPADVCGWSAENGYFDCGGTDEVPDGVEVDCPWMCQPTQTCGELGLTCGPHPECPDQSCGTCELGYTCEDGQCVVCTPDCTGLECGPDPVCGMSCGDCDEGLVCSEGACVEAPGLSCSNPGAVACEGSASGDTSSGTNDIESYGACQTWQYAENEHVYEFGPLDEAGTVTATLSGLGVDLDLFVLTDACVGDSCIASSAEFDLADETVAFQAEAGVTYYLVIDASGTGVGAYTLSVTCGEPCVPDCTDIECGPDPVCGIECGACGDGLVCSDGACITDPCSTLPYEGCCDGNSVSWCDAEGLHSIDCSLNDPPRDVCGWSDENQYFDCGGTDPVPDELELQCPWSCTPSQTCEELGLVCGPHPECPDLSCGGCDTGYICDAGACVECTPDCTGLECGPDPVCGLPCGDCDEGFVCQLGTCVEAGALSCAQPGALACDGVASGDTSTALNAIENYSCTEFAESGPEHVYEIQIDADAEVTLTLSGMTADLDLYVLAETCDGASCIEFSAGVADETVVFNAAAGTVYYAVVDGFDGAADVYTLSMTCGAPCVPDCSGLACGPDPVCGIECGPCEGTDVCNQGVCIPDPCDDLPYEGCCDGSTVSWCDTDGFHSVDCSQNESPADVCGWSEEAGFFDCGGTDPVPADVTLECPWTCQPTQTCEELGLVCGSHPECPNLSCGTCGEGYACEDGQCVVCVPDCTGLECGLDPVCGTFCGECEAGFQCADGTCVEAAGYTCYNPGILACGGTDTSTTAGASNLIESYGSCQTWEYAEAEQVYVFGPLDADATVTVSMTGLAVDLDLFVLAGDCSGDACFASSAEFDLTDEQVSFQATTGVTYYVVVDGSGTGTGAYTLSVECGEPCVPDCSGIECGPDPVCGVECGSCDEDSVCYDSTCIADPCDSLTDIGCCDGGVVSWCDANGFQTLDCSANEAPNDVCGWSEEAGFFDCGGTDPVPDGVSADCPWMCQPTQTCEELGLVCGPHPECPGLSCGACEQGYVCEDGACVECVPDCTDIECGPDPVCGSSCGECGEGFVCQSGTCVDAGLLTCTQPGVIACGGSVTGDTDGALNLIEQYPACTGYTENGGENIYELVLTEETDLTIDLTGLTADLDLYLVSDTCGGDTCVAYSAGTADEQIVFTAAAGTYYIIIDGFNAAHSAYTLAAGCAAPCVPDCSATECGPDPVCGESCGSCEEGYICDAGTCVDCIPDCAGVECGPDPICGESCGECGQGFYCNEGVCAEASSLNCDTPAPITCDDVLAGDTTSATNVLSEYSCVGFSEAGGEDVYLFTAAEDGRITADLTGLAADLDLLVLAQDCDGASCVAASAGTGDESVEFDVEAGGSYYIVVDGYDGAVSAYSLALTCAPPCVPDCSGLECGLDPVCGLSCGECGDGEVCAQGACVADPCDTMPYEGCCDGAVVTWCEDGEFMTVDCSQNEAPTDVCGYNAEYGYFDCGGTDEVPDGVEIDCPWVCQPTQTCEELGLVCGQHPECPGISCGACDEGFVCEDGACVEQLANTCDNPGALVCGGSVIGSNVDVANNIPSYGCTTLPENGGEQIYVIQSDADAQITLTLSGMSADLDLFVLEGACDGAVCSAFSASTGDETIVLNAVAGTAYYVVVDGYGAEGAASEYVLEVACDAPCVPDCTGLECGTDPVCGVECGSCADGFVCNAGACMADPCEDLQYEGCCEGSSVVWCDTDGFHTLDCSGNEAPADVCGYNAEYGYFDCGGTDEVPDGVEIDCPWVTCEPTQTCEQLALTCGPHPECPDISCGDCDAGFQCEDGACVAQTAFTCATPGQIACDQTANGDTTGAENLMESYPSCTTLTEAGGEHVYELTVAEDAQLTITLSDLAVDLDLFVLESACDPTACAAFSAGFGDEVVELSAAAGSVYYIVVDGYDGTAGAYTLDVACGAPCVPECGDFVCGPDPVCGESCGECPVGESCESGYCVPIQYEKTCEEPAEVGCGAEVADDSGTGASAIDSYSCITWSDNGPEHMHLFQPTEDGAVTVTLTGMTADLDLFVLEGACDGAACLAYSAGVGDEELTFTATMGTDYYIVVDGYSGASDAYTLNVNCLGCVPDCSAAECGPDPVCGVSCGECEPGFGCQDGTCVMTADYSCNAPWPLFCGDSLAGDSTDGPTDFVSYPNCVYWDESGPEQVYEFVPTEDAEVTVDLTGMSVDLDLFILQDTCDSASCVTQSAGTADEQATFNAFAGTTYYVVVDGYDSAAGAFTLGLTCGAACVPDCSATECGPDPVCGIDCGACPDGQVCNSGACQADPCGVLDDVGCCDGQVVSWCQDGQFYTIDCSQNEPPSDECGYKESAGFFDCGGTDTPPEGVSPDCPF